jgi:ribosomal protein S18 acetylase RimI-like enzyme
MTAAIRARTSDDIDECTRLLCTLDRSDRYPRVWPDDIEAWLTPEGLLGSWVAELDGSMVGHVALRRAAGRSMVTRLWVAPSARRRGLGSALCEAACARAAELSLQPSLEVAAGRVAAIALYKSCGWTLVSLTPDAMYHYVRRV